MRLACICVTWNRPVLLGRMIYCWQRQSDRNSNLLILDDAQQYPNQIGEGWLLFSAPHRYPTLGEKRNAAIRMACQLFRGIQGFMTWDDDDVYWPHAVESVSRALETRPWAQPRIVFEPDGEKRLKKVESGVPKKGPEHICYGGAWAWRRQEFEAMGGYAARDNGEDIHLAHRFLKRFGESGDSSAENGPWYFYNRRPGEHMSDGGDRIYAIRGQQKIERVESLNIGWNGHDIYGFEVLPEVQPRPF